MSTVSKKKVDGREIIVEDISASKVPSPTELNTMMSTMDNVHRAAMEEQKKIKVHNDTLTRSNSLIDSRVFINGNIIVRLSKKDRVKPNPMDPSSFIPVPLKFEFTDGGRKFTVDDPLPYNYEGVIVAFDEALKNRQGMEWLEKNARVQLKPFNLMEYVYMPEKRNEQLKISAGELLEGKTLEDFDSLFIIVPNMIDSYDIK